MCKDLAKSCFTSIILMLSIYDCSWADNAIIGISSKAITSKPAISNTSQVPWEDYLLEGDIDLNGSSIASIVDRIDLKPVYLDDFGNLDNAVSSNLRLWPNAIIPHEISPEFPEAMMFLIAAAIDEIQQLTCIRWLSRRAFEESYVSIVLGSKAKPTCRSSVGRMGGVQEIVLNPDCISKGVIIHEMMHTLGFLHEQSRSDRDEYVTILWENLPGGKENKNFRTYGVDIIDNLGANYDYSSILHGANYIDGVEIIRPLIDVPIGQRERLSETDVYKLNKLYECVAESDLSPVCDPKIDCVQRAQSGKCFTEPLSMLLDCGKFCSLCSKNLKHVPTEVPRSETRITEAICYNETGDCFNKQIDGCINGTKYIGSKSRTRYGLSCQDWSSDVPHIHEEHHWEGNACANPEENTEAWCYTSDPNLRWDYCYWECLPPSPILMTSLRDILLSGRWRSENDFRTMTMDDQRNTLIVQMNSHSNMVIPVLQSYDNNRLIGMAAVMLFIKFQSYRNLAQLKEMSYEDQRNTLIVELHKRLGEPIGTLQGKTNQQLVSLGNEMVLKLWNNHENVKPASTAFAGRVPTASCPESWIKTIDACYKEIHPQSQIGSDSICQSEHPLAHLPVFRHPVDFSNFIENVFPLLQNANDRIFKISGRQFENTSRWFLPNSENDIAGCEIHYLNWDDGEPNNHDGYEQCLAVLGKSKKHHDVPCNLFQNILLCQISAFDICSQFDYN